jgi:predicted enzyme related to lactoylglutathione lyase
VHNRIVHLELHTGHLGGALSFYSQLLDWRRERVELAGRSYEALDLGLSGGVVQCGVPRPTWLPYVAVPEIGCATDRAERLGAAVLVEPREGPAGWRSVVATPEAGELALWQSKPAST